MPITPAGYGLRRGYGWSWQRGRRGCRRNGWLPVFPCAGSECRGTSPAADLPIRLGVNVGGSLNDIAEKPLKHIKVGKCQYKKMFKPEKRGLAEERTLQMKKVISDTLKENVR